jgi:Zn-finger nucleic acid-binding protein
MRHEQIGETAMHSCGACGSSWLAPEAFAKLIADRAARGAAAASGAAGSGPSKPKPFRLASATTKYLRCPVCDSMMNRVNFGDTSGVIIDTCATHGVWFERDELHAILAFVEQGGLARRRAEAQQGNGRHYVREMHFDSGDAVRREVQTLIVRLDESGRSGQSSWSDLLKAFFE